MDPTPRRPVTTSDHLQPVLRLARRTVRYWRASLLVLTIGLLATGAVLKFRPRQYRSETVLYYREGMQWSSNEATSTRRIGQRLKDVLLSRAQLTKVIEDTGLYPTLVRSGRIGEAVEELRLAVTFKVTEGDIFVIGFTGDTPEEAQDVTRRLTDQLIEENARLRSGQAEVAQAFLQGEKKRNEAELAAKEAEYVSFLAKHPEFIPEQPAQGAVGTSLRPRARTPQSDADLEALLKEEQRLRRQIPAAGQAPGPRPDVDPVATRDEAEARLKATQGVLAERRARYTEEHPDVRSAKAAVARAEDEYQRAAEAAKASSGPGHPGEVEQRLAQVQADIAAYRQRLPRTSPGDGSGGSSVPHRAVALETEWARLNRQVAEARERLQQLDTKQFVASMTLNTLNSGQAAQIIVIDPAFLPARPVGMSTTRLLILGFGLSLFSGFGVAMMLGLLDDRLHEREDVERLGIAPVLVEVPPARRSAPDKAHGRGAPRGPLVRRRDRPEAWPESVNPLEVADPGSPQEPGPRPTTLRTELVALSGARAINQQSPEIPVNQALAVERSVPGVDRGDQSPALVRALRVAAKPRDDARLVLLRDTDSPASASFRVLRHRLEERAARGAILVTSPSAGEGKTFCAANLALALGEAWQSRVLLLEANLRSPVLAGLLGFQPPVCLAKQLDFFRVMGTHYWEVAEVLVPWLHVAAVDLEGAPYPELDGPALRACVEDTLRAGYDYVIVDTPPVLESADVNLVEESVSGIVMVLRAGKSRARDFRRAVEQIGTTKLLGVVWLAE